MKTSREEFEPGQSTELDFWRFVNERHAVWIRRSAGLPREKWTKDRIIAGNKFTNVFRELDRGTTTLRRWENHKQVPDDVLLWNVMWYRMLNRRQHLDSLGGLVDGPTKRFKDMVMTAKPLFTGAHQTWLPRGATPGDGVRRHYLRTFESLWRTRKPLLKAVLGPRLETAFDAVNHCVTGVGPFIAYEVVTDLRRTILSGVVDSMSWCNVNRGGGSARGLRRLGLEESAAGAWILLNDGVNKKRLLPHLAQHLPRSFSGKHARPLFELREMEHSLCEFDKYERVRTGLGTVRGGRHIPHPVHDDGGFYDMLPVKEAP